LGQGFALISPGESKTMAAASDSRRITVHIADPAGELGTLLFFAQKPEGRSKQFKPKKLVLNDSEKSLTIYGNIGSIRQKLDPEVYDALKEKLQEQTQYVYEVTGRSAS
jgi:hypothetical protein